VDSKTRQDRILVNEQTPLTRRHSGFDPESSLLSVDSRFRGNDAETIEGLLKNKKNTTIFQCFHLSISPSFNRLPCYHVQKRLSDIQK